MARSSTANLTKAKIDALKVNESGYGKNIKVTRNPTGLSYFAYFHINGKRVSKIIGHSKNGYKITDANHDAAAYRVDLENQRKLQENGEAERDVDFKTAATEYLSYLVSHSGNNIPKKRQQMRDRLIPFFGKYRITKIRFDLVQAFQTERRNQGAAKSTINREVETLRHFYTVAVMKNWVHRKPYDVSQLTEEPVCRDSISDSDAVKMLAAAKLDKHPMIYLFILIGLKTGMRHSEILSLRWEHIKPEKNNVFLPKTKTGSREQLLEDDVINALAMLKKERGENEGYVFAAKTKSGHINGMWRAFNRVVDAAGVNEKYTPHYMRHTVVTKLVDQGVPDRLIAKVTGHKTVQMITRYAHPDLQKAAQAMRLLNYGNQTKEGIAPPDLTKLAA